ncbi:MAG: PQQ-dependent dehydrogenase, methanol/ethanol family [Pseudomonadales bacterium]
MKLILTILSLLFTTTVFAAANVDAERALKADSDVDNWLLHGRTYNEQRHSPLAQIDQDNVAELGLAWSFETLTNRALEATPIVVDGVMYISGVWNMVYALDARTGSELWRYDPQVPRAVAKKMCCDAINRGVAVWQGKVFIGTLDGRLLALDAASGELIWQTQTVDTEQSYTITGAPRVVKGKVLIGNGGAEYGVRGYISAYDADSGEMIWRFYTVPGNPAEGFENDTMAMAAESWNGEWWKLGGGGTVWDHMAYDPELDLLYIGVGNGSPWNRRLRSPGGGDNLFLSSIVAVRPDTGEYVWHYQVVPSESWDYTATQHMILADIVWQGKTRKVLMQAPKSGFFMIIDRITGELLSAEPFVEVNWASHYDMATGRPVENPGQDYAEGTAYVKPSGGGAHNWQPMAYSPDTGLVYIPIMDATFVYTEPKNFVVKPGWRNQGVVREEPVGNELMHRTLSDKISSGHLLAWDPIAQRQAWIVDLPTVWNGGVLSTAGQLVFQGNGDAHFVAYAADSGKALWQAQTQSPVLAAPISYRVDGEQYVTVMVGNGGAYGLMAGMKPPPGPKASRVLTYKLGSSKTLPPVPKPEPIPDPPSMAGISDSVIEQGRNLYANYCAYCHGVNVISGGTVPDLRHLPASQYDFFQQIVIDGIFESVGMPSFSDDLNQQQVEKIRAYVVYKANEDKDLRELPDWLRTVKSWWYELLSWAIALVLGGGTSSA